MSTQDVVSGRCKGEIKRNSDGFTHMLCLNPECRFECGGYDAQDLCKVWNEHITLRRQKQ